MYIFDEHAGKRSYIPLEEYEQLVAFNKQTSLIGFDVKIFGNEGIQKRISELETFEQKKGFIFVAEKLWLLDILNGEFDCENNRYYRWLEKRLYNIFPNNFSFVEYEHQTEIHPRKIWKLKIETKELGLNFKEFTHLNLNFPKELEILIYGSEQCLSPSHLVAAYEFMHDLEYMMEVLSIDPGSYRKCDILSIETIVQENPYFWSLNQISEYGAEFDVWLRYRGWVRKKQELLEKLLEEKESGCESSSSEISRQEEIIAKNTRNKINTTLVFITIASLITAITSISQW